MNKLERDGLDTLKKMELKSFGNIGHRQISKVLPDATVSHGDNFEFDYFVIYQNMCLVGEMSGLGNENDIKKKYRTFKNNINLLRSAKDNQFFNCFNIPPSDRHLFDEVKSIHGFFIANKHERFDLDLTEANNAFVIYQGDWKTIELYAKFMGKYARFPFLKLIKLLHQHDIGEDLRFEVEKSKLTRMPNRMVATNIDVRADVFTFETHPVKLLSIAEVYRRELMPVVAFSPDSHYQRRLDIKKLESMFDLVHNRDFTFPNTILVALNEMCIYDRDAEKLIIPEIYGSISIIDGQHRLFSYANCKIPDEVREEAKILVTALRFKTDDPNLVLRCSAKTFIEINQEQKRISSDHISEIAYSVLGESYPKALAAQVILRCNQRPGKVLHGMFNSSQTTKGVYKAATVISYLSAITNKDTIERLVQARGRKKAKKKLGYLNLFHKENEVQFNFEDLLDAESIIERGVMCLERYFACVKRVFAQDWPQRDDPNKIEKTTLAYAKVFSGFIKLLGQFIKEGLDWSQVEQALRNIRTNIIDKRKLPFDYTGVVLEKGIPEIPDDQPSVNDTFKFLNMNRTNPTSIAEVKGT